MKKKAKYGFNTGNRLLSWLDPVRHRRVVKDQCVVVKTFRHKVIQPKNAEELNSRILQSVDSLVQDGGINGDIEYKFRRDIFRWHRNRTVLYSLNKKKRWLLPKKILDAVEEVRSNEVKEETHTVDGVTVLQDPAFHLTLLERQIQCGYSYGLSQLHPLTNHNNDSVSYSSTLDCHSQVVPKKSYSSEPDLKLRASQKHYVDQKEIAREKRRKGHNQHFRDLQRPEGQGDQRRPLEVEETDDTETSKIPEIHYEICGPQHSPNVKFSKYKYYKMLKKAKKKCKHFRNKLRHYENLTTTDLMALAQASTHYEIDIGQEVYEETKENELETVPTAYPVETYAEVPLLCLPRVSRKYQNKSKRPRKPVTAATVILNQACSNPVKSYGKKAVVYIDQCHKEETPVVANNLSVTPNVTYMNSENSTEMASVALCTKVSTESVNQKTLESCLGEAYLEGCSSPRRFSVNIPLYMLDKFPGRQGIVGEDQMLIVCTVYEENNNENSDEFELAKSFTDLNMEIHGRHGNVELSVIHSHLSDTATNMSASRDLVSLIHSLAWFLHTATGPSDVTSENTLTFSKESDKSKYRYFGELNTWEMRYYTPLEACGVLKEIPLLIHQKKVMRLKSHSVVSHITSTDHALGIVCDICLNEVPLYSDSKTCATSLSSCKHWFCDECWKEHLMEKIRNGSLSLECPSYDCSKVVDLVTLLSLVGHEYYQKHWYHLQHTKIEQRSDWQWCPQTSCDRVVQGSFKRSKGNTSHACVECRCLHAWCFDCQKEPHWPIPCDIAEKYVKLVKQKEEDKDKIFYVDVKKCPSCKYPIDKNGGCQHMVCRCGFSFCWECLAPWSDHGQTLTCPKGRTGTVTLELEDTSIWKVKKEYFAKAARYRKKRNQLNHCVTKVKGRMVQVMMNLSKKDGRRRGVKTVIQKPLWFDNLDFFIRKALFLYEVYHLPSSHVLGSHRQEVNL